MDWIGWLQVGLLVGIVSAVGFPLTLQARCAGFKWCRVQDLGSTGRRDITPSSENRPGPWNSMATHASR